MNAQVLEQHYLPTQLMPRLVDQVSHNSPLLILDSGFGVAETVAFFGEYRCRLHFSAFYENLNAVQEVDDEEQWFKHFQQLMNYPAETRFHLCLFWDLFSYFNDAAMQGFMRALAPFVNPQCVGHGFAVLNTGTLLANREFGLLSKDQLIFRPATLPRSKTFPRSRARLSELFRKNFEVGRSVLHQGGVLELTLSGL